jgi:hypothetical protein
MMTERAFLLQESYKEEPNEISLAVFSTAGSILKYLRSRLAEAESFGEKLSPQLFARAWARSPGHTSAKVAPAARARKLKPRSFSRDFLGKRIAARLSLGPQLSSGLSRVSWGHKNIAGPESSLLP